MQSNRKKYQLFYSSFLILNLPSPTSYKMALIWEDEETTYCPSVTVIGRKAGSRPRFPLDVDEADTGTALWELMV